MLTPALTQMPIFILTSIVLGRISQPPTPFDSESFLTLTTLAHSDPTMTLPIVLGIITMANVESSRWSMTQAELDREKKVKDWNADKRAQGHLIVEPKKYVQSTLRLLSVGRILIGALVPGVSPSIPTPDSSKAYSNAEYCTLLGDFGDVWPLSNLGV